MNIVPSKVKGLVFQPLMGSSTSLNVTWAVPDVPNGVITEYEVNVSNVRVFQSNITSLLIKELGKLSCKNKVLLKKIMLHNFSI